MSDTTQDDADTGGWLMPRAPLPSPLRYLFGLAKLGRQLHVAGGLVWAAEDVSNAHYVYAPYRNEWSRLAPMRSARASFAFAAVGSRLYALGGLTSDNSMFSSCEVYDIASDSWSSIAPMPDACREMAVGVLGGKIHVVGGLNRLTVSPASRKHYLYDPDSDTWSERSPLNGPRTGIAGATLNGLLYLCGGADGGWWEGGTLSVMEVYDPESDSYTELAPMPTRRMGAGATGLQQEIYVFGGIQGEYQFTGANESYSPSRERWTSHDPIPGFSDRSDGQLTGYTCAVGISQPHAGQAYVMATIGQGRIGAQTSTLEYLTSTSG